jgi:hypothetical protein
MAIPPAAAVPLRKFLRDKTCERDGLLSTLVLGPAKIILRKIQRRGHFKEFATFFKVEHCVQSFI